MLQISGTDSKGDYLVIGGTAEKLSHLTLANVSRDEARKAVVDMGFAAFGRRLQAADAPGGWAELAHL